MFLTSREGLSKFIAQKTAGPGSSHLLGRPQCLVAIPLFAQLQLNVTSLSLNSLTTCNACGYLPTFPTRPTTPAVDCFRVIGLARGITLVCLDTQHALPEHGPFSDRTKTMLDDVLTHTDTTK